MRALLELLYPPACPACAAPGVGGGFCAPCDDDISWIGAACERCALPHAGPCRMTQASFDTASAAALYDGRARDAVLRFKLGGERRAAAAFAAPLVDRAPDGVLTFVPATRRALAERGFNPAQQIARALGRATGRAVVPLLRKSRETSDQSGLGRAERAANLAAAIAPLGPAPAAVVLVDDILTTGATAGACAAALKRAGAHRVHVLTFARTP